MGRGRDEGFGWGIAADLRSLSYVPEFMEMLLLLVRFLPTRHASGAWTVGSLLRWLWLGIVGRSDSA